MGQSHSVGHSWNTTVSGMAVALMPREVGGCCVLLSDETATVDGVTIAVPTHQQRAATYATRFAEAQQNAQPLDGRLCCVWVLHSLVRNTCQCRQTQGGAKHLICHRKKGTTQVQTDLSTALLFKEVGARRAGTLSMTRVYKQGDTAGSATYNLSH